MKRSNPYAGDGNHEFEESGLVWGRPSGSRTDMEEFKMKLIVNTLGGDQIEFDVDPWTTIAEVKTSIQAMKGFQPSSQILMIRDRICDDEHQLSRYTNMRSTMAFLTIVNSSGDFVGSGSSSSNIGGGNHPHMHAAAPAPAPAPAPPAPAPAAADNDSDDEAVHELLALLRDQRQARLAAEEEESESSNGVESDENADGSNDNDPSSSAASPHPSDGS